VEVGVGRRVRAAARVFLAPELKLTASRARVTIAGGEADVPNYAVHALLGLGVRF
jgi:hypothetical protein